MHEDDVVKIAFKAHLGYYELLVLLASVSNGAYTLYLLSTHAF